MKILYHLVVNDRAINQYEDMCQIIRHLRAPDMLVNDEYGPGIRGTQVKSYVRMKKTQDSSK